MKQVYREMSRVVVRQGKWKKKELRHLQRRI